VRDDGGMPPKQVLAVFFSDDRFNGKKFQLRAVVGEAVFFALPEASSL